VLPRELAEARDAQQLSLPAVLAGSEQEFALVWGSAGHGMKFEEYETDKVALYREFCGKVRDILEQVIRDAGLRPQSLHCREKDPKRLKQRLEQIGSLGADNIEELRRDLAGVRVIFYTNTDVERFHSSGLMRENFEIEKGGIKIHHPTKENDENQYRGDHYTVRLKDDRTKLPEYARFKGLRCEVQVQTVLNHAWSETSHDIIYKNEPREGFGTRAMELIERRFQRIMTKYLLPAGYEFQRVQHDYERLQQGKALFDRDLLTRLDAAADNNERHEIISLLKQNVLPNYDDIGTIYPDVVAALVDAAKKARTTPVKPIETPFGDMRGHTAEDVEQLVVGTIADFKYADVILSFNALRELYRDG
jgi:ppGpp synthetase/RelA/SpoT-type nucleotidyltranferase